MDKDKRYELDIHGRPIINPQNPEHPDGTLTGTGIMGGMGTGTDTGTGGTGLFGTGGTMIGEPLPPTSSATHGSPVPFQNNSSIIFKGKKIKEVQFKGKKIKEVQFKGKKITLVDDTSIPYRTVVYRILEQHWNSFHTTYYLKKPSNFDVNDWVKASNGETNTIYIKINLTDFRNFGGASLMKFSDTGTNGQGSWDDNGRIGDFTVHYVAGLINSQNYTEEYGYLKVEYVRSQGGYQVMEIVSPNKFGWLG